MDGHAGVPGCSSSRRRARAVHDRARPAEQQDPFHRRGSRRARSGSAARAASWRCRAAIWRPRATIRSRPVSLRVYGTTEGLNTSQMTGGVQSAGRDHASGRGLAGRARRGAVRIVPEAPAERRPASRRHRAGDRDDRADRRRRRQITRASRRWQAGDRLHVDSARHARAHPLQIPDGGFGPRVDAMPANGARPTTRTFPPGRLPLSRGRLRAQRAADDDRDGPRHPPAAAFPPDARVPRALRAARSLAAAWGVYRLHLRSLRRQFAAVLDERSRLAREMHDTLIQGCVGVSTLLEAASNAQAMSPALGARAARARAISKCEPRSRKRGRRCGTCAAAHHPATG